MSFWWNKRSGNQRVVYSASGPIGLIVYVVVPIIAFIIMSLAACPAR